MIISGQKQDHNETQTHYEKDIFDVWERSWYTAMDETEMDV